MPPAAPAWFNAAYSSGKPALGVGAGNTPAIIDETADILLAVNSIIHSKTFDNGMICASEQSVIVLDKVYDKVKKEFAARGCYFLDKEETEHVRKTIIINGALNAKIVGQSAFTHRRACGRQSPRKHEDSDRRGRPASSFPKSLHTRNCLPCLQCIAQRTLKMR